VWGMERDAPRIIDAEFTVVEPKDDRPIWQRYRLEFDKGPIIGAAVIGLIGLLRYLAG